VQNIIFCCDSRSGVSLLILDAGQQVLDGNKRQWERTQVAGTPCPKKALSVRDSGLLAKQRRCGGCMIVKS
jgi:hypothetical protein